MFLIRKAQMEFFARRQRASFVGRMADYLASAFPERFQAMTTDEVRAWASAATAKAERYGIDTEPEAAQLVLLLLLLGLDADEKLPWVGAALADGRRSPLDKVRVLIERARERVVPGISAVVIGEVG